MDQFASVFGKKGNLMRLDCRSLEHEYYPFNPQGYSLVLVDSRVKHELADSPYNKRRASCERVAARLGLETLRDATAEALNAIKGEITAEDYMRAKFVIEEKDSRDASDCPSFRTRLQTGPLCHSSRRNNYVRCFGRFWQARICLYYCR